MGWVRTAGENAHWAVSFVSEKPSAFNSFFDGSFAQAISLHVQVVLKSTLTDATEYVFQNFYENCKEYEESLNLLSLKSYFGANLQ